MGITPSDDISNETNSFLKWWAGRIPATHWRSSLEVGNGLVGACLSMNPSQRGASLPQPDSAHSEQKTL